VSSFRYGISAMQYIIWMVLPCIHLRCNLNFLLLIIVIERVLLCECVRAVRVQIWATRLGQWKSFDLWGISKNSLMNFLFICNRIRCPTIIFNASIIKNSSFHYQIMIFGCFFIVNDRFVVTDRHIYRSTKKFQIFI
jgi:hypothetical protein